GQHLTAVSDAASAFAEVVNNLIGSELRDDALYEIAKTYEDSERTEDMVYTYLQLVTHFPGSEHHMEALYEVLKYFHEVDNFEIAALMYPELSAAYPSLFPEGLTASENEFLTVMRAYFSHVDFAWFEYHHHHIPYRVTCADLGPDAAVTLAALNMARGNYRQARKQLEPVLQLRTNDLCGPATFLLAQCCEREGKRARAEELYSTVASDFPESGLADDAKLALSRLGEPPPDRYVQLVKSNLDYSLGNVDCYYGDQIVVFAPYTVTVKMRQYNMPNIWEQSQVLLEDWTGTEAPDRIVVCVDQGCRSREGNPILLPGCRIGDPPKWSLGFESLARQMIRRVAGERLAGGAWVDGLSKFAAASLQYDLVTETRDAIGSASAVVLPQQDVIDARERALGALQE
ncbi:MAG: tetratricopeptide repeat protein, partial [Armatimonadota bacterium]